MSKWIQLHYVNPKQLSCSSCKLLIGLLRFEYIRNIDNALIYGNKLHKAKYMRRADMIRLSGLGKAAGYNAIEELIDNGILIENKDRDSKERYYQINPEIARAGRRHDDKRIPANERK